MTRRGILALALLAAAALGAVIGAAAGRTTLDGLAEDLGAALRAALGARLPGAPTVVVLALDESSLADPRLAALPRVLMSPIWAELTGKVLDNGGAAIGYDFIFAYDAAALSLGDGGAAGPAMTMRFAAAAGRWPGGEMVIGRSAALLPARRFSFIAGPAGLGYVDIRSDPAGIVRRAPRAFAQVDGGSGDSLAGALLRSVEAPEGGEIAIVSPEPLTSLPTVRVIDALDCDDPARLRAVFADKIVLVGGVLPTEDAYLMPDRFLPRPSLAPPAAPCDLIQSLGPPDERATRHAPGVYVHAAAIDAVRRGWALKDAPVGLPIAMAAVAAALAAFAALTLSPWWAGSVALAVAASAIAIGAAAQEAGWLIGSARPVVAAGLAFAIGLVGRILFLDRRARHLRASFGKFVSPQLVDRMARQETPPDLSGEQREISVMFADLSGFTAMSERLDGRTLTATVNRYLEIIATEVDRSGGYVDKFIGDAVMALWNAPADLDNHAAQAVDAAWAIRGAVAAAAEKDAAAGAPGFAIKIGLNAGPAIVGNVGARNRLNYTAVGDTVNLAARLESLPSVFGAPIVLGPASAAAARGRYQLLEIGSIQVKGRREPAAIHAPLAPGDAPLGPEARAYGLALSAYRGGEFADAAAAFRALSMADWDGAPIAKAMAAFADEAAADPPGADWAGQIVMRGK